MNHLMSIHKEAKKITQERAIRNNKKITIIALSLGILFTISFYYVGVGVFDYFADNYLVLSFLIAGIQSVFAMMISQLVLLYFLSFSECTTKKNYPRL